ncbi:MAG: dipicolinate synthase subunit DpsA [Lachnospiraceae bacterium]|nr:dipicolinate synthase subunit DpsA [Lachnospiraceae bacterium]
MQLNKYSYAVLGGDLRQVYLVKELAAEQKKVCHYALPVSCDLAWGSLKDSLEDVIENTDTVLGPIPLSRDGVSLNQNGEKEEISLQELLRLLKPGQLFCAGCIPDSFSKAASKKGVFLYDYMKDDALAYFNSIATAEGIICEAIKNSHVNLRRSKCAVLGYGKCGKTLANYLKGMFCHVTVVMRSERKLAEGAVMMDNAMDFAAFSKEIGEFDFIFNTIPQVLLTEKLLAGVKSSALILDIASAPGGVDFEAAKEMGIKAVFAPGLPGKYAPHSSAKAIKESVYKAKKSLERE